MSKLFKLKTWFSLEDAAKRLASSLQEQVTVEDVLQLVVEGHLALSWYARHVPAEKVARACRLHYVFPPILEINPAPKKYVGPVYWRGDWAFRLHEGLKEGETITPYAALDWMNVDDKNSRFPEHITGVYRLELEECGALKDWVHSMLTGTRGDLITIDGYYVSDEAGTMWRIMEYSEGSSYELPDGRLKKAESFYHPSGVFPDPAELVIRREHIEAFEIMLAGGKKANESLQPERVHIGGRERPKFLAVIKTLALECGLPIDKTTKAEELIQRMAEKNGVKVQMGKGPIAAIFKEIRDELKD